MKKTASFWLITAMITLTMVGCGKTTGRTLTSATGSIYECLVVMNGDAHLSRVVLNVEYLDIESKGALGSLARVVANLLKGR